MSTTNAETAEKATEESSTDEEIPPPEEIREIATDVGRRGFDTLAEWLHERADERQGASSDD